MVVAAVAGLVMHGRVQIVMCMMEDILQGMGVLTQTHPLVLAGLPRSPLDPRLALLAETAAANAVGVVAWVAWRLGGAERARIAVPVSYTHLTLPTICSV